MNQTEIDRLRARAVPPQRSPIDGRCFTTLADGGAAEVDAAVAAARAAYDGGGWSRCAPAARKKTLAKLAELIEAHALELAVLGVRDNGTEIGMAYKAEPLSAAATIRLAGATPYALAGAVWTADLSRAHRSGR